MTLQALHDELKAQSQAGAARLFDAMSKAGMAAAQADRDLVLLQLMCQGELALAAPEGFALSAAELSFAAKAGVLRLADAAVQVTVSVAGAIRIVVLPHADWTFDRSFPLTQGSGATSAAMLSPAFVLTTLAEDRYRWTDSAGVVREVTLARGLNLATDLSPDGLLGVLGGLLSASPSGLRVPACGTLDVSPLAHDKPAPVMNIAGPLSASLKDIGYFGLGAPQLVVRNFPEDPGGDPFLMLAVPLRRKGRELFQIATALLPGSNMVTFGGWPENGGGLSLTDICDLAAGSDVTANLPDFLREVFDSVGLKDFHLTLVLPAMRVVSLGVGVGAVKPWRLGEFTVDDLRLGFVLSDPFGPAKHATVTFTAQAEIFPSLFQGKFDLLVSADTSGDWLVSAGYTGVVSFNDLVAGISRNAVSIPKQVADLEFEDFGISFARAGGTWNWSMYGAAEATFELPLIEGRADADLRAQVAYAGGAYSFKLVGSLAIGACLFTVEADFGTERKVLTGTWSMRDDATLGIADLAAAVGLPAPPIPAGLDLALKSATLEYDFANKIFLVTAESKTYGKAVFLADSSGKALFAFGVNINLGLKLANLPLVGDKLPFAENLGIDTASVWLLSRAVEGTEAGELNAMLQGEHVAYKPLLPAKGVDARVILGADFMLGPSKTLELSVPLGGGKPAPKDRTALLAAPEGGSGPVSAPAEKTGGGTQWINVQRQFGIFQFNRIGIGYSDGVLSFALDAGVTLGPFSLFMDGLSVGSKLDKFEPVFNLDGLGLSFEQEPVSISGALLKVPADHLEEDVTFQFDGSISIRVKEIGIAGLGSYAQMKSGAPSMFLYAQLMAPLGGDPAFFVTGLMGGVGFNRTLTIPDIDEVQGFPLLVLGKPPAPGQPVPKRDPLKVLRILEGEDAALGMRPRKWIAPRAGSFWLAAGLQFTTYKLVETRALVVLQPTDAFTVALLGLTSMQLPLAAENAPTVAYAELQLRAVFQPTLGVFAASAVLSNTSYVLHPDCHLTGGFAMALWYPPSAHAGDFVMTLGGYHPALKVPEHYPAVPRLGLNWSISDTLVVKGNAYFALTPSCVMVGGALEFLFNSGDLKAWFTAHADFLASWRPFFYTGRVDVEVGVSYRLGDGTCHNDVGLSVGAALDIWGPPTGGRVHLNLVVVTYTIEFGEGLPKASAEPLGWNDFTALLPDHASMCTVVSGPQLARTVDSEDSSSRQRWIVRPRGFTFTTQSAVPASAVVCEGAPHADALRAAAPASRTVSIRPMNKAAVDSVHKLRISRDSPTNPAIDLGGWSVEPRSQTMPASLWGAPPAPFTHTPATPTADKVDDMLVGFSVSLPAPALGAQVGPVARAKLAEEFVSPGGRAPLSPTVAPDAAYLPTASSATVAEIAAAASGPAQAAREALCQELAKGGIYTAPVGNFTGMAAQAGHLFADAPMQQA